MEKIPRNTWLISKVIIAKSDGRILAIRRSSTDPRAPLTWDLAGGMVDYGEDPTEAAQREALEETGQVIHDLVPVLVRSHYGEKAYAITLMYHAVSNTNFVELSYEHDQYKWVTSDEFQQLDAPQDYKDAVKLANLAHV